MEGAPFVGDHANQDNLLQKGAPSYNAIALIDPYHHLAFVREKRNIHPLVIRTQRVASPTLSRLVAS